MLRVLGPVCCSTSSSSFDLLLSGSAASTGAFRLFRLLKFLRCYNTVKLSEKLARIDFSCDSLGEFTGEGILLSNGGIAGITGTIVGTGVPMVLAELHSERQQIRGVFAMLKMLQFLKMRYLDLVAIDLGSTHQNV